MSSTTAPSQPPVHRRFSPSPNRGKDAGLRAGGHYRRRLPAWRYELRERLLPYVRSETPVLARIQSASRTPLLDSYFAFTANLGTHTFFMTFLPICFWCGLADTGVALVHMLGLGVYVSGALKDLVGLPRPLSPPLQRITMSGSAALEYGFPSTHTTNAVSVAMYALYQLYASRHLWSPTAYYLAAFACCCYATSITAGRVYCGMHGFCDVIIGAVIGALIAWVRIAFGTAFDMWVVSEGWPRPAIVVGILALAVRFHPEPADDCPCFDDSVAFLGVIMGVEIGTWHYGEHWTALPRSTRTIPALYPFTNHDLIRSGARLVGGIIIIFLWRAMMKPLLLALLPPVYRFFKRSSGLGIPRRFFLQATEYTHVPPLRKDDNVIPSAAEIPSMLATISQPRRRRISVGPQSEADARELIAQRREQRKSSRASLTQRPSEASLRAAGAFDTVSSLPNGSTPATKFTAPTLLAPPDNLSASGPENKIKDDMMQQSSPVSGEDGADEEEESEIFSALQKPRTHYDVEVVTKLVVYAGIAWWAVEGNPVWFRWLGLV